MTVNHPSLPLPPSLPEISFLGRESLASEDGLADQCC